MRAAIHLGLQYPQNYAPRHAKDNQSRGIFDPMPRTEQVETILASRALDRHDTALWPFAATVEKGSDPWRWLTPLIVLAAALRGVALNQQLWYDEIALVVISVRQSLVAILTVYTSQNQHTLYSVLAHVSVALFGEQPWALRLPAVMFGVASIPALYFFARRVTTRREALLASALMAVSYHHVWFSQNARGYTALLFFTLLATYFFLRGLSEGGWRTWLGYSLVMALGMYTHLTMGFVAVGHGLLYLWLLAGRVRETGRWSREAGLPLAGFLVAGVLTLALYAPLLPQLFARTLGQTSPSIAWEWKSPLWMAQETLRGLRAGAGGALLAIAIAALVALAGLVSYWRENRYVVALTLLPAVVTAAAMMVLEHNLWPRFFFFAIGFACLFLVRGVIVMAEAAARLAGRDARAGVRWGMGLAVLMLAGSAWSLPRAYRYPKQDFVGAMRLVDTQRLPDEPVVTVGLTSFAYQRYFGRDWRAVETYSELESVRAQGRPTWLVYAFPIHLKARYPEVWKAIQTDFRMVAEFRGTLGGGEIYVCRADARQPAFPAAR